MSNGDGQESSLIGASALARHLRALTPARVGLARTGISLETSELLDFQLCHAQARDAVHSRIEAPAMCASISEMTHAPALRLHSAALDRATYLRRPDLGRQLDEPSRDALLRYVNSDSPQEARQPGDTLALIVADGLSAIAVERHAIPLLKELLPRLQGFQLAPVCVVEQGRVAIGDEIGEALKAQLSVVLIGERPGLSSPDSLGAYITWRPRRGRTDAERNCISNIRAEGLSYPQAAAQLSYYLSEARARQLTGIGLKEATPALREG
jgi:ethanolamine ammonia-lyase small subunit